MSVPTVPVVDAELWVVEWLQANTGVTSCTETDDKLGDELPLFQVARIGGGDDGYVLDRAMISLHAYAVTRDLARKLAYQGRTSLFAARGVRFQGAVVTKVATIGGPAWTPYTNTNLRRVTGTYQVSIKAAI